jgi:hypothetical protein
MINILCHGIYVTYAGYRSLDLRNLNRVTLLVSGEIRAYICTTCGGRWNVGGGGASGKGASASGTILFKKADQVDPISLKTLNRSYALRGN